MENHTVFSEHGVRVKAFRDDPGKNPEAWMISESWMTPQELREVAIMLQNAATFMESAQ